MSTLCLQFFSPSSSHTTLVFHTKRYGSIPMERPPNGAKIAIFDEYLVALAGVSNVVNISSVE